MEAVFLNIFFAYSREDSKLRERLDKHLSGLKRRNDISTWYDGEIGAGKEWAEEIDINLAKADIILLLISADFIASDYCFEIEMKKAISRHEKGDAVIIPILIHPCDWSDLPFSKIQGLPQNGKPITSSYWENSEIAFNEVANSIKTIVEKLRINKSSHLKSINEVLKEKGNELRITLEQLEDSQISQEIIEETIASSKKDLIYLTDKTDALKILFVELTNSCEESNIKYQKIIKNEQIELNRIRIEKEKLEKEIEKLQASIKIAETKKKNIEEDIKRMRK